MQTKPIKTPTGATEASGVTRQGNELLIVSDADPGAYYSFDLSNEQGPLLRLLQEELVRHVLPGAALALDFESIDVLADGRIVALSERLRALIGANGLVMQYDDPLSELGERGLEGLAVRPGQNGASEVAVLWEGGWVEDGDVQPQIRRLLGKPLLPIVFTHEIKPGETGGKRKVKNDAELVELKVPQPDQDNDGWRFRAPDLAWHQWRGQSEPGFIVLLNSQRPAELPGKPKFGPRWLQRFDRAGNPVGRHFDLAEDLDEETKRLLGEDRLKKANWEGLGWYEAGKSLVLVHDKSELHDDIPVALVVALPSEWR